MLNKVKAGITEPMDNHQLMSDPDQGKWTTKPDSREQERQQTSVSGDIGTGTSAQLQRAMTIRRD